MASKRRAGPDRSSIVLVGVLVASVVAGIAATFLAAPATPLGPAPARGPVPQSFDITVGIAVAVLFLLLGGVVFFRLLSDRPTRIPSLYATVVAVFLVAIAFLAIVHFISPNDTYGTPTGHNTTGGGTVPNETLPGNLTPGPLPVAPGVPGWIGYAILGIGILLAVLYLAPALRRATAVPEEDHAAPVRRSLESALHALANEPATDARGIVIALYARLLEAVAPYLEELDSATPREIERVCVDRFGIAPAHAGELTRLFEEARYSSHPFQEAQVARARGALEAALADLRVRSYHGGA